MDGGSPRDRRVQAAVENASDLDVARHDPFVQPQVRAHRRDELIGQPADIPEPQRACGPLQAPLRAGGEGDDLAGISQEKAAGRGQLDVPAVANEQRAPDARLERLDLLRQRRRGDMQTLGRAPEVQLLGDGDEVTQLAQFHAARAYAAC